MHILLLFQSYVYVLNCFTAALLGALLLTVVSIAFFNFAGVSITKELGATNRKVLDTLRTLVIWAVSLAVKWQAFYYLQVKYCWYIYIYIYIYILNQCLKCAFLWTNIVVGWIPYPGNWNVCLQWYDFCSIDKKISTKRRKWGKRKYNYVNHKSGRDVNDKNVCTNWHFRGCVLLFLENVVMIRS